MTQRRDVAEPPHRPVRVLPDPLIDQIAAGEVVERPASVVKELVENSLDAGAGRVRVELREGGAAGLTVADDGRGMTPDDARLAVQRHATSKLADADDLRRIGTFGFRGEALPSIASVSRFRLRTRARGAAEGFELRLEGGKLMDERAAGGPEGTRIEVADLFFNVPARRKFLKTAGTEWGHVADWLARVALARPDVHFDCRRDGRDAFAWPATEDPLDRIAAVLSDDAAAALVAVAGEGDGARLHGFASRPDHHRPTAAGVHLFVNGRPVRDRLLRHALLETYRDVLPRGRFPTAVLFLELPPDAVDVNVHPAKWEVRFADPRAIHRLVHHALRAALQTRSWLAPAPGPSGAGAPDFAHGPPPGGRARFDAGGYAREAPPGRDTGPAHSDWLFAGRPPAVPNEAPIRFAAQRRLGQVLATYLVLEGEDGLLLVDQHAAHERVLYEGLRAGWLAGGVERQPLLFAMPVELEAASVAALGEGAEATLALGFEIDPLGEESVLVRSVPSLLAGRDPEALVRALADELRAQEGSGALAPRAVDAADRILASLACHAARRAGDRLPEAEQDALLRALDGIPWAPTCPHGRPVAVPMDRGELERRFSRR